MLLNIIIILIATYTTWYASEFLAKGTEKLGDKLKINPSVKGATLDAIGSSFPEFCTVVFCLMAGSFEAGIGAIAGSALFNILIIPSLCVLTTKDMPIKKIVVYRDGLIYIVTVTLLIITIAFSPMNIENNKEHFINGWIGIVAIALYIGYILLLILQSKNQENKVNEKTPLFIIIALIVFGMAGIAISIHFLVDASLSLFNSIGLSEALAGVTILAAATSLPDAFLSVISAKHDEPDAALSNTLGSNTFDILICLGLPILYIGGVYINWAESQNILFYLLGSSILSMFLIWTGWILTKTEAIIMLLTYALFLILVFLNIL